LIDEYSTSDKNYNKFHCNICSLCGEEDESVNRNTNHGMCDDCWEDGYNDSNKKKQAFINNFRLKRGESFKREKFNYNILASDKLKVLMKI
jgi:hypothetical protein